MAAPHSILVPLDGSPASIAALDHAVALAEDSDATIDVLYIEEPEERAAFSARRLGTVSPYARGEIERELDNAVDRAQAQLGSRVSRRIRTGDPLRKIIETAAEGDYDLIVMGTHGRVGRLHAMLGSVAEGVVRNAPCPVLTVRETGGGYQSFAERRHGRPMLSEQRPHPSWR